MWEIIEYPPQPFGECTLCKRHTCGEYTDDEGNKHHKWVYTNLEMDKGGSFVIGINCVENMADNLGVTKKVVEKVVEVEPTPQQALSTLEKIVGQIKNEFHKVELTPNNPSQQTKQQSNRKRGATK